MSSLRTQVIFLLAILLSFSSFVISTPYDSISALSDEYGMTPVYHERSLMSKRATTTLCYPYRISLTTSGVDNNSTIIPKTCYCDHQGQLTSNSSSYISSVLAVGGSANQTAFSEYLNSNGYTRAQGISNIESSILSALNARTATCTYPTNAIPNSCDNCGFACNSGYKVCGTSCVTNSTTCVSGVAKRNFAELGKKICPQGRQACATTFLGGHNSNGWECVATETDIESCGGCQFPLPGGATGKDCTQIRGASTVGCVKSQCVISSCMKGWRLKNKKCVRDSTAEMISTSNNPPRLSGSNSSSRSGGSGSISSSSSPSGHSARKLRRKQSLSRRR